MQNDGHDGWKLVVLLAAYIFITVFKVVQPDRCHIDQQPKGHRKIIVTLQLKKKEQINDAFLCIHFVDQIRFIGIKLVCNKFFVNQFQILFFEFHHPFKRDVLFDEVEKMLFYRKYSLVSFVMRIVSLFILCLFILCLFILCDFFSRICFFLCIHLFCRSPVLISFYTYFSPDLSVFGFI